ncbi:hypothetical protein SHLA_14c000460 [Shinella sp. DD12]|nr:hypothetical protein SHLA_14c000460 [Shinella sp. DD12]
MIDENLCRNELSPAERASQTARRKAIYLELHPETAAGIAQAAGMNAAQERGGQVGHDVDRFDAATAKATGQSERVVRRDAERGEKVIPEVIDLIAGTKLDTGTYLDKLKRLYSFLRLTRAACASRYAAISISRIRPASALRDWPPKLSKVQDTSSRFINMSISQSSFCFGLNRASASSATKVKRPTMAPSVILSRGISASCDQ